jgi:hypothetical protein
LALWITPMFCVMHTVCFCSSQICCYTREGKLCNNQKLRTLFTSFEIGLQSERVTLNGAGTCCASRNADGMTRTLGEEASVLGRRSITVLRPWAVDPPTWHKYIQTVFFPIWSQWRP